jgi:hypothetical protein
MRFSRSDNRLGEVAQSVLLRRGILVAAAICRFSNKTEMHPGPVLHGISHHGKTFPQVETSNQLVNSILEGIDLLRVPVVLSPVCNKLFTSVSGKSGQR